MKRLHMAMMLGCFVTPMIRGVFIENAHRERVLVIIEGGYGRELIFLKSNKKIDIGSNEIASLGVMEAQDAIQTIGHTQYMKLESFKEADYIPSQELRKWGTYLQQSPDLTITIVTEKLVEQDRYGGEVNYKVPAAKLPIKELEELALKGKQKS